MFKFIIFSASTFEYQSRRILASITIMGWAAVALVACSTGEDLPSDPGLITSDFGSGLNLLMDYDLAIESSFEFSTKEHLDIKVMTKEQIQTTNPHEDHSASQDLVIALYSDPAGRPPDTPVTRYGHIRELRCYLADYDNSTLSFDSKRIVEMGPDAIVSSFGEPYAREDSGNAETHMIYKFKLTGDNSTADASFVRLTTSHRTVDSCYAFSVALE